jgi:hypothetical protein
VYTTFVTASSVDQFMATLYRELARLSQIFGQLAEFLRKARRSDRESPTHFTADPVALDICAEGAVQVVTT